MTDAMRRLVGLLAVSSFGLIPPPHSLASAPEENRPHPVGAAVIRPIIPGFERFARGPTADPVRGGRLLLGELNCTACHAAGEALDAWIARKQAPILDGVGGRVRVSFLRDFLTDPLAARPGTTMPDLFAGLTPRDRGEAVEALVHFLATTGGVSDTAPGRKAVADGRTLYHQVGCIACHGPADGPGTSLATSVPLGDLAGKYTVASLAAFLQDPLEVRPSGRMPGTNLSGKEAADLANFLLRDLAVDLRPNLAFRYYEGSWSELPDFDGLEPAASGEAAGFDLSLARRDNDYALRFEGFLKVDREGDYTVHVLSDDGSRLWIDGRLAVSNDGVHAPQARSDRIHLTRGAHRLVAGYFNAWGESVLDVEYEGPGRGRQPLANDVSLTEEGPTTAEDLKDPKQGGARFVPDAGLVEKGRTLFATVGCASCHQLREEGGPITAKAAAKSLGELDPAAGCLSGDPPAGLPRYGLGDAQRSALSAAVRAAANPPPDPPAAAEVVARTLTAFNCYACHRRDDIGGVEEARDASFRTTQKEMGDEGRIPPHLDGVGAKLSADGLRNIFARGADDRPYMLTRMPRFGAVNLGPLIGAFAALDTIEPVETPAFSEPLRKVKSAGRFLVGAEAYGCIKCHNFKGIQSTGIQAVDMARMTRRLNRDWFHRYVVDPQRYRPGTRMPSAWPMGQCLLPKVLGGDTRKQVEAVWLYLSDGPDAAVPYGLGRDPIPLAATREAILYRNFIEGAGTRAIAVGYPERANLAFDANDMRLALLWRGGFLDASRHWTGRGEGFQPPMGDDILRLPAGPGFATLEHATDAWPTRAIDTAFRGYTLGKDRRPTFLYDVGPVRVEDFPDAVAGRDAPSLRRTLTLTASGTVEPVWFRAAVADSIRPEAAGGFTIDGEWTIRIESPAAPIVRRSGGKDELLVPVEFRDRHARIVQEFAW